MMIKHKINNYTPDFIVHPGVTLSETLASISMSQTELAKRTSRPETVVSEIINGNKSITPETAIQLERALGIPASFWNNLEKNYQELIAKKQAKEALSNQIELARNYPYPEMVKNDWIQSARKWEEKVENLLAFFAVDNLSLVDKTLPVAFRQHNGRSISSYAIHSWLRKGLIDSREVKTKPFSKERLNGVLSELKTLSVEKPKVIAEKLTELLSDCGIALVFTQGLPKTYVCGAARWLTPDKAMVQLSLRGRYADIMWFTLYHELGHLTLHSKKKHFVDLTNTNDSEEEKEANDFAAENLVPSDRLREFAASQTVDRSTIRNFASLLKIHPGIVVGRLQHEGVIEYKELNDLRAKYRFVNE